MHINCILTIYIEISQLEVSFYLDEKIYLQVEKIYPTEKGLFLLLNHYQSIAIPLLHADADGCYLSIKVTKECPFCGWERISYAIKCHSPNCPSNQKKKEKPLERVKKPAKP